MYLLSQANISSIGRFLQKKVPFSEMIIGWPLTLGGFFSLDLASQLQTNVCISRGFAQRGNSQVGGKANRPSGVRNSLCWPARSGSAKAHSPSPNSAVMPVWGICRLSMSERKRHHMQSFVFVYLIPTRDFFVSLSFFILSIYYTFICQEFFDGTYSQDGGCGGRATPAETCNVSPHLSFFYTYLHSLSSQQIINEGIKKNRSCALCRKRKLRCNRQRPCSNCIRAKAETCVYESHSPGPLASVQNPVGVFFLDAEAPRSAPAPATSQSVSNSSPNESSLSARNHTSNLAAKNLTSPLTPRSQAESITNRSVLDAGKVWSSIHNYCSTEPGPSQQQQQPPVQRSQSPYAYPETDFLNQARHITGGAIHFHRDHHLPNSTEPALIRSVTHKTRFFGQSHWINVFQVVSRCFAFQL